MVEGGLSAGFFNALEKGLPIIVVADRASSPLYHNLIIRSDLKDSIKSIKDLAGKKFSVAVAFPGSSTLASFYVAKTGKSGRFKK